MVLGVYFVLSSNRSALFLFIFILKMLACLKFQIWVLWIYYKQGNAQRPEVRIVTWNNDELTTDALPVLGFEHYKAKDYSLAHAPFSG